MKKKCVWGGGSKWVDFPHTPPCNMSPVITLPLKVQRTYSGLEITLEVTHSIVASPPVREERLIMFINVLRLTNIDKHLIGARYLHLGNDNLNGVER